MKNEPTDNDVYKTIPASVSQHSHHPLYIIIALWCQQQNRWITRNDIARAFSISVRRASFQVSYITRHQKIIKLRTRRQVNSPHPCIEIWVNEVMLNSLSAMTKKMPQKDNKSKRSNLGAYRSRVGNGISPGDNIWRKLIAMRGVKFEEDN
ncbi:TPA: CaiF/GrlA family transcriptional regulator [Escherichia coli]